MEKDRDEKIPHFGGKISMGDSSFFKTIHREKLICLCSEMKAIGTHDYPSNQSCLLYLSSLVWSISSCHLFLLL